MQVAVIGFGSVSKRHRANIRAILPQAQILGVSSSDRKPQGVISDVDKILYDIDSVISHKIDFAIVASPSTLHFKHAKVLVEANIPVLVEKPICASLEDASLFKELVSKSNVPVAVAYCLRYLPSLRCVKNALDQNKIGRILMAHIVVGQYLPDWRPGIDYQDTVSARFNLGGGALLELSHEIDYAQLLFGKLSPVYSRLKSSEELGLEVEDIADLVLENPEGMIVNMHLDFLQRKPTRFCRVIGTEGSIFWDLINNSVVLETQLKKTVLYKDQNYDKNSMYTDMVKDFISLIDGSNSQGASVSSAIETVELVVKLKLLNR